jgi:hypothetical protein
MAALIALAAIGVFAAGIFAGVIARGERGHPPGGAQPHPDQRGHRRGDLGRTLAERGACPRPAPHSRHGQDDGTRLTRPGFAAGPCDERRPR